MSTIRPTADPDVQGSGSGIVTGLKVTTAILAIGILVQAWLASTGLFQREPDRIDGHGMLGNVLFLVAVIQAGLALYGLQKGLVSRNLLISSILTIAFIVIQIGLGYGTRESADAKAWHIPNGVLLMGFCTYNAVLAWMRPSNRS